MKEDVLNRTCDKYGEKKNVQKNVTGELEKEATWENVNEEVIIKILQLIVKK
jgi:hypothetical protein